jgi:GMP synthase-like glutamine amidotransferase
VKVLIIDNHIDPDSWGADELVKLVTQNQNTTAVVRRGPHGDLPKDLSQFSHVVISGSKTSCLDLSPWVKALDSFILDLIRRRTPLLGVCYGHQSIQRAIGGSTACLRRGNSPEFGWSKIELLESGRLLQDFPSSFFTYSSHWEEVTELQKGFRKLAKSLLCSIQAYEHEVLPIFGIQFHPERGLERAKESLSKIQKTDPKRPLLHPDRSEELYRPEIGSKLFQNFLKVERA